ncbi:MAG: hypothetical protein ABI175_21450 [Polyangiales bacterium]
MGGLVTLFPLAIGCSGSSEQGVEDGAPLDTPDAAVLDTTPIRRDAAPKDAPPEVDRGTPSDVYPAYKPDLPVLQSNGGYVMVNPKIVTVTWPADKAADKFEAFGDHIGGTEYWRAITEEYGISPAISGPENHVRVTETAPARMTVEEVDAYVVAHLTDPTTSKWPVPTDDTIYILYLSPSTTLDYDGSNACFQIGGYHTSTEVAGKEVAYAIIPYCKGFGGGYFESMTSAASHELGEAATDPYPRFPGYNGFDLNHLAWEIFQNLLSENGDACALYRDSFYQADEPDFTYQVQRQWSNKNAAAGHDPCAPAPEEPYFTVVPQALESITVNLTSVGGSSKTRTRGYAIPVGETRTFTVGYISDAPTERWAIDALEGNPIYGGASTELLDIHVVGGTGKNGEIGYVTVKVLGAGKTKSELLTIVSTNAAGTTHYLPILIGSM